MRAQGARTIEGMHARTLPASGPLSSALLPARSELLDARRRVHEPRAVSGFFQATRLTPLGGGRHRVECDASWKQGRGVYGGLTAALFVRALEAEAAGGQRLVRVTISFTAPLPEGPAEVRVTPVRRARNVSVLSADLVTLGEGVVVASCLATLARPRPQSTLEHHGWVMPATPPVDATPDGPSELYLPAFTSHLELRQSVGARSFAGEGPARIGGYCRLREPCHADPALVAALLDAWPPAAVALSPERCSVASLELSVHFLVPIPRVETEPRARPWFFFDASSDHVEGGLADERAVLFDEHGRALATAHQLIALFPSGERSR